MAYRPADYLDLSACPEPAAALFKEEEPVWSALPLIAAALEKITPSTEGAEVGPGAHVGPQVFLAPGVRVDPGAVILGPAWIGPGCHVRAGAYLRQNVIAGREVVLGNSCEFKNCVIFDACEVPHFNYVGDSVLGHKAHLGAGVILSNVRLDRATVPVFPGPGSSGEGRSAKMDTGLRKFGAVIGDRSEIGCNSVLSPGSLIGRDCILYPGTQWRGALPASRVVKFVQQQQIVDRLT